MTHLHGRDPLLHDLEEMLVAREPGCLLGPRGSGRTRLLDALAERVDAPVRRVHGSGADLPGQLGYDAGGIAAYTRIPGGLVREGSVVLVDDADLLDRAAGVLLAQLGRAGVPLVVVTPAPHHLPGPLADEVSRSGWHLHRISPLADDAVLALAADLLGDDLSAESAAHLLDRAAGSPAVAVELLAGAATTLQHTATGVDLGQPGLTDRLVELHAPALRDLEPADHAWLVRLALAEQLPTAMVPPAALDHLVAAGVARHDAGTVVVAGRLLADVVRAELAPEEWRRECTALADELAEQGTGWIGSASLLRVRAGETIACQEAVVAAGRAVNAHRWVDASDLLAGLDPDTVTAADQPVIALLRGASLSGSGEHEAAERHLRTVLDLPDVPPDLLVRTGAELGLLHAVRRSDPLTAVEQVREVADLLTGAHRARLEADLVKWHLMAGLEPPPVPGAEHAADLAGQLGVKVIAAMIDSLDGPPTAARSHVADGLALVEQVEAPGHAAPLLGLSHYLSLAFEVRLDAAEEWAVTRRDSAARSADPSLGMWEFAAAELRLHAGRLDDAAAMSARATRHLAWQDFTGLRAPALALHAAVDARRGTLDAAVRAVGDLPPGSDADVKVALHVARVHSERHRRADRIDAAATTMAEVGHRAVLESHRHLGVLALDEAWMLRPDPEAAAALEAQADRSPLAAIFLERARAWHDRDPDALEEAARAFADGGLLGRAVHGWTLLALVQDAAGDPAASARARRTAAVLVADTGCSSWPGDGDPAALTARELEIARLVAARVRSREIALRLGLSVRTVDNHVGRILRKLGVSRRSEVEHVFRSAERGHRPVE